MADKTKIEWTDSTCNAINGCTVVSPGCTNCYAMKQAHRVDIRRGLTRPTSGGMVWTGDVRFSEKALLQPLRWTRPRMIFWNAHGDTFHENVPDEWIDKCFAVMALTPHHTHQVLTKRPDRMRDYLISRASNPLPLGGVVGTIAGQNGMSIDRGQAATVRVLQLPLPNVWLGTSVEDQKRANERIPDLIETPAAVRWLSMEPLLGPVDLTGVMSPPSWVYQPLKGVRFDPMKPPSYGHDEERTAKLDWIVLGGESGPKARPMHPDWARSIRDQCAAAGVPFHFKQWGEWAPADLSQDPKRNDAALALQKGRISMYPDGTYRGRGFFPPEAKNLTHLNRVGKKAAGRLLDGVEHNGMPKQPTIIFRQSAGQLAEMVQ